LLSHHEELEVVQDHYGKYSLAARTLELLHSMPVQLAGMGLLVLDVCIIITELFLDIKFPSCHTTQRDGISCCPVIGSTVADACGSGLMQTPYEVVCESRPAVKVAHSALVWTSVAIGFTFLLEVLVQASILQRAFLRNPLYVADALIVVTALSLEISLYSAGSNGQAALSGLLMLSRTWRFVRIGHALYMMHSLKKDFEHSLRQPSSHAEPREAPKDAAPPSADEATSSDGRRPKRVSESSHV